MTTPSVQTQPYLPRQRNFPKDTPQALAVELDKTYIDIANKVNSRIIGTFATGNSIVTGETWYLQGQQNAQQTLRKVFTFTGTGNIAHGLTLSQIARFTRMYGCYTDGTNFYSLVPGSNVAIAGQIGFYISPANIIFTGAGAPALTSGNLVIEFLSFV